MPFARTMSHMSESVFTPGTVVVTPRGAGEVVDVRATPSGAFVIGVGDADGEVRYFVDRVVRLSSE